MTRLDATQASTDHGVLLDGSSGTNQWLIGKGSGRPSTNGIGIKDVDAGTFPFWIEDGVPSNRLFVQQTTGNVGIATTAPGSELDVKGTLRLSGATSGYVGFAPPAVAGSTTYTLPNADGTGGYVLSTNGTGTLSWVANSAGSVTSVATGTGLSGGPITTSGTINVDVGTTASKIVQLTTGAQYPAVDGNLITNVNAVQLQARNVSSVAPTGGQVLAWNTTTSTWQPTTDGGGTVTNIATGTGLSGGPISTSGTINVDVGTTASKIVQLTVGAQYPAVDGNLITNVNAVQLQARNVSAVAPTGGQVLTWNSTTSLWQPEANSVASAITALTGDVTATGPGSVTATIGNDRVTSAMLESTGIAVNRLLITDAATGASVSYAACSTNGEYLHWTASGWACTTPTGGTVTNVVGGTGLSSGPVTTSGTLHVDVGTTASKIVQLTVGAQYPAVDGNLITNVNAVQLQGRNVFSAAPSAGQVLTWNNTASRWEGTSLSSSTLGAFVDGGNSFGAAATLGTNDAFDLKFETAGSVGMTLKNGGNVGIGTTSPGELLHVQVPDGTTPGIKISQANDTWRTTYAIAGIAHNNGGSGDFDISSNNDVTLQTSGGNVGIGTTAPGEKLEVNGNVKATSFISTSDERLKKEIIPSRGLDLITKLDGVEWKWRSDNTTGAGVIAQELEKVWPQAVVTDKASGYKAVRYTDLIAPLIQSTKELYGMCQSNEQAIGQTLRELASVKSEVKELRLENSQLKQRLESLEDRLMRLENGSPQH